MIQVTESPSGDMVFVDNGVAIPVDNPDTATVLRDLVELQKDLTDASPEALLTIVQRSLVRLVTRAVATTALETQKLADDLDDQPAPTLDNHLLFTVDEIELAMEPLTAVTELVLSAAQQHPTNTPEAATLAASYAKLATALGGLTAMFGYKLEAYKQGQAALATEGDEGDEADE